MLILAQDVAPHRGKRSKRNRSGEGDCLRPNFQMLQATVAKYETKGDQASKGPIFLARVFCVPGPSCCCHGGPLQKKPAAFWGRPVAAQTSTLRAKPAPRQPAGFAGRAALKGCPRPWTFGGAGWPLELASSILFLCFFVASLGSCQGKVRREVSESLLAGLVWRLC